MNYEYLRTEYVNMYFFFFFFSKAAYFMEVLSMIDVNGRGLGFMNIHIC